MAIGKGSLSKLDELKKEYGPKFKEAAPKVKRIGIDCFRVRCSTALNPARLKSTWRGLRVAKATCTRKTCPLLTLGKYLEMLERTRPFRQSNDDPDSRAFWWGVVGEWKRKFQRERGS